MLRLIAILSVLAGISANPFPFPNGKIVGGKTVSIRDFPYQVSMQMKLLPGPTSHQCGGSIIGARAILTAAHCVVDWKPLVVRIVAGVDKLREGDPLKVSKLIVHPDYNPSTMANDVGLIILAQALVFSDTVQPIVMSSIEPPDGAVATVSGWGSKREGGFGARTLQAVDVNIVGRELCGQQYAGLNLAITDRMICAGVCNGGKDSCQGDSGGPLVVNGELVGVVSFGVGCGRKNYSGVYAAVATLRDWIDREAAPYI